MPNELQQFIGLFPESGDIPYRDDLVAQEIFIKLACESKSPMGDPMALAKKAYELADSFCKLHELRKAGKK